MDLPQFRGKERAEVSAALERWAQKEPDPGFFKLLDVANRIAGVGSLGAKLERWEEVVRVIAKVVGWDQL